MPTVEEKVKANAAKTIRWKNTNPELWENTQFETSDSKIFITKELLDSKAYRSLSRVAMLVYQDLLAKREMRQVRKKWVIANNGNIIYPYLEAEKKGHSSKQFRNAMDELQGKGLTDITHIGKGGRKPKKGESDPSTYWIDTRWKNYETEDFRPARNPRKKDTRKDRGWYKYNANKK